MRNAITHLYSWNSSLSRKMAKGFSMLKFSSLRPLRKKLTIDANCWTSNLPPTLQKKKKKEETGLVSLVVGPAQAKRRSTGTYLSLTQNCSISFVASSIFLSASASGRSPERYMKRVDRQRLMQIVRWPFGWSSSASSCACFSDSRISFVCSSPDGDDTSPLPLPLAVLSVGSVGIGASSIGTAPDDKPASVAAAVGDAPRVGDSPEAGGEGDDDEEEEERTGRVMAWLVRKGEWRSFLSLSTVMCSLSASGPNTDMSSGPDHSESSSSFV